MQTTTNSQTSAPESSKADRGDYPFGWIADEATDRFHGTRVRVLPRMDGDTEWTGEVGMVLNHGRLLEVAREGRTLRVRVAGEFVRVLTQAPERKRREITWRGDVYEVPSMAELESMVFDSVCETPDGETVEPDHPDSWLSILGLI